MRPSAIQNKLTGLLLGIVVAVNADTTFFRGQDLSSLPILEASGVIYKSLTNVTLPAEDILGAGGMNTVRLRIWVNPPPPSDYSLDYTLKLAKRFSSKGYNIYLDMHFSDTWADPQHQITPKEWPNSTVAELASALRTYVSSTLTSFHAADIPLSIVSLGNEIRHGMLWPTGYVDVDTQPTSARIKNFTNLAQLWSSARAGVDDALVANPCMQKPQVMIHIDDGWNATLQTAWYEALVGTGYVSPSSWDVSGVSFYPFYGVDATLANLQNGLDALSGLYNKPVQVVETDWPAICSNSSGNAPELSEPEIPVSAAGQSEWVQDIIKVVKNVPNGLGQGVHYWEPTWLNNTGLGSNCTDAILFRGDWSGWPKVVIGYARTSVDMFQG